MPPRRLVALIHELPTVSRTVGRDTYGWGISEELAAQSLEHLSAQLVAFLRANTEKRKGSRIPKPVQVPRPWRKKVRPSGDTPGQRLVALARSMTGR